MCRTCSVERYWLAEARRIWIGSEDCHWRIDEQFYSTRINGDNAIAVAFDQSRIANRVLTVERIRWIDSIAAPIHCSTRGNQWMSTHTISGCIGQVAQKSAERRCVPSQTIGGQKSGTGRC